MKWEVKDELGRTVEIEGEKPPTEEDLNNIFSVLAQRPLTPPISPPTPEQLVGVQELTGKPYTSILKQTIKEFPRALKETVIGGAPGYAVRSAVQAMQRGEFRPRELVKEAEKGLLGEKKVTGTEILKEAGVKGIPGAGLGMEMVTDPLMYGGYKAITGTIGKGLKVVGKIPAVATGVGKVVAGLKPLKEMFVTKTTIKPLNALINKFLTKREYLKGEEMEYAGKVRNIIQGIAGRTGRKSTEVEQLVVNLIENPTVVPLNTPKEAVTLANTLKLHFGNILTKEMKAGVPISQLAGEMGYFPRITTKEATQYLRGARIGNAKVWNVKLANALRRKTGDFTLEEFNDFVAQHGLESLGGKKVQEFFMEKPALATAIRGIRSAKAVTSAQFLRETGEVFGKTSDLAPKWWVQLPEGVTKLNPDLKGKVFDPEVAGEITRVSAKYLNPQEAGGFLKVFDTVQNAWKRWTLAPFPKYHLRNMVGNLWNNYLAGTNPKYYIQAARLQKNPSIAPEVIKAAKETGVLGKGWYSADIEKTLAQQVTRFGDLPKGIKAREVVTGQPLIQAGMQVGKTVENNARLAHFLDRLAKGDDKFKAAESVKKYLFDYQDLTDFEKQVMKRLMPFYTWTRKNVPLQLEKLWEQPQKFAPLMPLLRGRNPKQLLQLKYVHPELYERLPVEFRRDADTVTYVPLEGLIPAGDLAKMGISLQDIKRGEMPDFMVELLTPYLRAPIEMKMGRTFYYEREIEKYPKETQELLRMDIPVRQKYILTTVLPQARLLGELNKITKKKLKKEELTVGEQIFFQTLSVGYKMDIEDLRIQALRTINRKIDDLRIGMISAIRNKRPEEQKRIQETIRELLKQVRDVQ